MAQTISGAVTSGVTITSNPLTITSAGSVTAASGVAVTGPAFGQPAAGWTIGNAGVVTASAASANAIDLTGGTIGNTGTISGYQNGVDVSALAGTVTNSGTIDSSPTVIVSGSPNNIYDGIYFADGGSVTNTATGVIFGGIGGVDIAGGVGTVSNAGDIHTTTLQGNGVALEDGGTVTNTGTGAIYGDFTGIAIYTAAGTVTNIGTISAVGLNGYGIYLGGGGTVTNSGSIIGTSVGVYGGASAPATVTNTGYIYGADVGIKLTDAGGFTNLAGALVLGDIGVSLTSGTITNAGTIASLNATGSAITFSTAGAADRLIVDAGAEFEGTVTAGGAASVLELAVGATAGTITGVGTSITAFGTIAFDPSAAWTVDDTFAGINGETVTGFSANDSLVLVGATGVTSSFAAGTETLTLTSGSATSVVQFGSVALGGTLVLSTVGADTVITLVPCFVAGTLIATPRGGIAVETLRAGDQVLTALGEALPIIWAGRRQVDCDGHAEPAHVRPIRIEAGAFAPGVPRRDLFLSPDHAVFAEGVLIPVKHLVNQTTVRQCDVDRVTYHHIELSRHAVILAEGLPAESYLDTGDRFAFAAQDRPQQLHPVFGSDRPEAQLVWEALGCASLRIVGPEIDRVRALLTDRAARRDRLSERPQDQAA